MTNGGSCCKSMGMEHIITPCCANCKKEDAAKYFQVEEELFKPKVSLCPVCYSAYEMGYEFAKGCDWK